jgi:alkanesulfonate monooxygenase SsuD/methylene tetrahydromethanopterin reductase-like flavin-dependent oxidoreductase (luciferase family)
MEVFGESLGPQPGPQAREAEEQGFDGIVVVDHFFSARPPAPPRWRVEPFVALGAAAATTTRIQLAAMVINANFHHPSVIAHSMASLDHLSNGRAELGLGGGWYALEHTAFGLPWGEASERQARLLECARVCRTMLENHGVVSHRGDHFELENSVPWEWQRDGIVPVIIGGSRSSLLTRAAEIANRIDLLHATAGGVPVIDESLSRSLEELERLLRAVHARAAGAGNSVKISATLTAIVVPSGG